MRVIAGIAKGRALKSVLGKNTRPTTDKVKEALFSMISPYLNGGLVLDLFAGTGGLGIEALSRGMDHAIFVDYDRNSVNVVKANLEMCGFTDRAEVYRNDFKRAIKALNKRQLLFDLIFLDPPYKMEILEKIIRNLVTSDLVSSGGIIVAEHDAKLRLPDKIESLKVIKQTSYGSIGVTVYLNESI
ncbi:16S rRNA (guanine(966)-N(2))-methyltransferase RsmD [Vulcanibacillus modesticaldus]|uniref:16S rRNA (Guanine(966)-N(2))-methyltransferase RsmD n=1 Tax=Vulcanibacillus modesticaldus TaxID=337097 RepID=A0A1D2YXK2_9BACI|nr:16S rRNA (guanine(966)-N(2))-methyltransferase RsmD [Vulcanibacillus modesticaldus]OEG00347.1 16S rRNA (guanine(966)-N(2))-methyltransferase RsmD [Vulcanibacillus modesticaldus]